jgi:hypothetical protein
MLYSVYQLVRSQQQQQQQQGHQHQHQQQQQQQQKQQQQQQQQQYQYQQNQQASTAHPTAPPGFPSPPQQPATPASQWNEHMFYSNGNGTPFFNSLMKEFFSKLDPQGTGYITPEAFSGFLDACHFRVDDNVCMFLSHLASGSHLETYSICREKKSQG